jgi:alginate O-acetyltransferase complex protein AlgI
VLFPTTEFALFFIVVYLVHWLLNPFRTPWKLFMIAASYFFYAWWDWHFVFLLGGFSVIAQLGALAVHRGSDPARRRTAVIVAVAAGLAPLAWFKYYGFFSLSADNALGSMGLESPLPLLQILLPVGISFYTFMGISYIVDVYRRQLEPAGWLDTFLYLSFFPHLVAGPIVRGGELFPQIAKRRDPKHVDFSRAAYLIFAGLFKKVVLSSYLATAIVDPVFGDPGAHSSLEILVAVYGYAVQIYADFSGYTDIAIGIALLLGFEFPQNFDRPYTARSLQDFWRRWHITLSRWLRDYLYIPLGGSRRGKRRTYINILITMLLGGLWHGAAWIFVIWGGIHGLGQVIGHARRDRRAALGIPEPADTPRRRAVERLVTFHIVCLGWIFFRSGSLGGAFAMLKGLVTQWGTAPLVTITVLGAIALGVGVQYLPHLPAELLMSRFSRLKPALQGILLGGSLLIITTLGPQGVAPFIYFQF